MFELLTMSTPRGPGDATELTNPSSKAITFKGMKFQSLYFHDPQKTLSCNIPNPSFPNANDVAFILTIWEAIVLLPLAQGTTSTPAYLVKLTDGALQEGDLADRVLWKRLSHLYVQGTTSLNAFGVAFVLNPDTTARYNTEAPVVVKAKCRIDDRHGLFYVRNYVHDLFLPFSPSLSCQSEFDCDDCLAQSNPDDNTHASCGAIPIENDFWSKIYYSTR